MSDTERSDAEVRRAMQRLGSTTTELKPESTPASEAFGRWMHRELRRLRGLDDESEQDPQGE